MIDGGQLPKPESAMELYNPAAKCKIVSKSPFLLLLLWPPQGMLDELSLPLGREDFSICFTGTAVHDCWQTNIR